MSHELKPCHSCGSNATAFDSFAHCSSKKCFMHSWLIPAEKWNTRFTPENCGLEEGGVAQKAFWHALEFCNDPDDRNIRRHWNRYKGITKTKQEAAQ